MKLQIKYISLLAIIVLTLLMISSCSKSDFLDINTNPNNAATATSAQLMSSGQAAYAFGFSSMLERCGGTIVQHYINGRFDNYGFDGSSYGNQWAFDIYAGALADFNQIIKQGTEKEEWSHVGISKLQVAYIYSMMVDLFGDVPFTEAIQGAENFNPKADNGEDIYPRLFTMIDEGIADLNKAASLNLGTDDLIYSGDINSWIKMGNTLKLKMYNQTRLVNPTESKTNIDQLLAGGDIITSTADNFSFQFTSSNAPDGRHPNFQADYAAGSLENNLSRFFVNLLVNKNDPRIPYYFYRQTQCDLNSAINGGDPSNPGDDNGRAMHGIYPVGGKYDDASCQVHAQTLGLQGAGILPMLTNTMRIFIEAESALTLNTVGDPRSLLEEGINSSFSEIVGFAGVPMIDSTVTQYIDARLSEYDAATNDEERLGVIMMEKYVALFGNGIEAYNDQRRTNYPNATTDLLLPILQNGPFPLRIPIPPIEITANQSIDPVMDLTVPVFWDIN